MQVGHSQPYFTQHFSPPSVSQPLYFENVPNNGCYFTNQPAVVEKPFFTPHPQNPVGNYQIPYGPQLQGNSNGFINGTYGYPMKRRFTGIPVQRTFNGMPLQNGWMTPSPLCSPPTPLCSDASPLFQYTLNNRFSPYGQVVDPLPVLPVDEVERILRDIENEPRKPVKRARKKRETSTKKKSPPQSSPSALQIQKNHTATNQFQTTTPHGTASLIGPSSSNNVVQGSNVMKDESAETNPTSREEMIDILKEYGLIVL